MICGIDVGQTGAIALLYSDTYAEVHDMPMLGKEVNGYTVAEIFREFTPKHIWLEQQAAFKMGRTSAFNFARGYGVLQGVIQTLGIPYTLVTPLKWKKSFSLSKEKDQSRLLVTRFYPHMASQVKLKKNDGRAEALLIAKYGSEQK